MEEAASSPEVSWTERGTAAAAALAETWSSLAGVGRQLGRADWDRPTACPGWSVRDQFSHLIGIERLLSGQAAPAWDRPLGDHVKNDFAVTNEPWVAVRRSRPGGAVLEEFVEVTADRLTALARLSPGQWAEVGPSPVGEVPYARFMVTRVFDSWVHEQDVRHATGRPGGSGGLASSLALDQVQSAMGYVVGKKAAVAEGAVVAFSVTGSPGDARTFALGVQGGRAAPVGADRVPSVSLTLSSLEFLRLGCGRTTAGEAQAAGGIGVEGDAAMARTVLAAMSFTF